MKTQRNVVVAVSCLAAALACGSVAAQQAYSLRGSGTGLISYSVVRPGVITRDIALFGISAGETVVGLDMRPQNGLLYALGVDATANTGTLYVVSTQTGLASVVGSPGSIAFVDGGNLIVDFPDPAVVGWGFDINPAADRVRVVAGSLNFRVDPNTGLPIDGVAGGMVTPDGPVSGGTTTLDAAGYTNNRPNNGGITTLYTLDAASNSLYIQNPPNNGIQVLVGPVTLSGNTVDFTAVNGFDIPSTVTALANNAAVVSGAGFAAFTAAGITGVFRIDLTNGVTARIGNIGNGTNLINGFTLQQALPGVPAIALNLAGNTLVRFSTNTPGTTTSQAINVANITANETLVALDFRPQTGQLYALGVNATGNTGTLYRLDPQTGAVATVGPASGIAFIDTIGNPVDLPDPATVDYGFDFNPTVDRIRVTAGSNLNFRLNPNNGAMVDGDTNVVGIQPDTAIQGSGSAGVEGAAYTNSFGQPLDGTGVTTLYTLDAVQNTLFIQNPANGGTQTAGQVVTLGGAPLDFNAFTGFDIPASVRVTANGQAASGRGYAVLGVGGVSALYQVDLATAQATALGTIGAGAALRGLTLADNTLDIFRDGFE